MYQSNLVVFDEINHTLQRLCDAALTGLMYIATDANDYAGIIINNGRIVDAGYRDKRGTEALTLLKTVSRARYFFKEGWTAEPVETEEERVQSNTGVFRIFEKKRPPSMAQAPGVAVRGRVLVIDDSKMVRTVVNKILLKHDFEVVEAVDGEQGLQVVASDPPDLILLDIVLPGIDGNEVFRRIKQTDIGASIPIIILTSNDSLLDKQTRADGYLNKPFKPEELMEKMDSYFPV